MKPLDNLLRVLGHSLGLPDNYGLIKCIGKGAEGEVWQAADLSGSRMVAIKLVGRGCPQWQLDMVRREAAMLSRLGYGHVNIVRPLEMLLTTKHFAVVMELVAGEAQHLSSSSSNRGSGSSSRRGTSSPSTRSRLCGIFTLAAL
jgi:serine/threonine protein kinase